jgi:predicted ribosome quality control (RQC) complex YloA/Tae2 family protein
MKTEVIYIPVIQREITYYIGKDQSDNFKVIDCGNANDLWFHAKDVSSCHVICEVPDEIDKKEMRYIIKTGGLLCKNNTNKLKNITNLEIMYTQIKNITKTKVDGCVLTKNSKTIMC